MCVCVCVCVYIWVWYVKYAKVGGRLKILKKKSAPQIVRELAFLLEPRLAKSVCWRCTLACILYRQHADLRDFE